tara:strand:+ start:24 stop:623 length:600 start_codon:yes stop_codon:yes gene_type:complete
VSSDGLEIERKWRLTRLPDRVLRADARGEEDLECWRLRQAYLPPASEADLEAAAAGPDHQDDPNQVPAIGRIRAIETAVGPRSEVRYIHTLKSGSGLIRREIERPLSQSAFEAAWAGTEGRRLEKTRWRIPDQGVLWEIDLFEAPLAASGLVLAEAEAPSEAAAMALEPPEWLAPVVDREVTDDPMYTNAEIAFRLGMA